MLANETHNLFCNFRAQDDYCVKLEPVVKNSLMKHNAALDNNLEM